jgi:hypothetical protein
MRKPLMVVAIIACLIMSMVGGLIRLLQGWFFFVIALYLLATEFETGRRGSRPLAVVGPGSTAGSRGRATTDGRRGM